MRYLSSNLKETTNQGIGTKNRVGKRLARTLYIVIGMSLGRARTLYIVIVMICLSIDNGVYNSGVLKPRGDHNAIGVYEIRDKLSYI